MYITPLSLGSRLQDSTVLPPMSLELVSLRFLSGVRVLTWIEPVKVWDTIGEEKVLKGEYKVLAGRMYVALSGYFA